MSINWAEQPDPSEEKRLTIFGHELRLSDSPYVEVIGRIRADSDYSPLCPADSHWNMLLVKLNHKASLSVWGPMTKARIMPYMADAEFLYITFKLGTFMPHLPVRNLLDVGTALPQATNKSFWLNGSAWQFPDYENADTFVDRLVRAGLLMCDGIVDAVLQGHPQELSPRSTQRRFLLATGLTQRYIHHVERARRAAVLLQQGAPVLDTVYQSGYFDQPHMTRALKHLIGQTPAQISRLNQTE